jgi:2,3-bisphosphoglycerate-independent phosphoglycerate mutase
VVCDPGLATNQVSAAPPILYALCDSAGQSQSGAAKRFHEQEPYIVGTAPRDATKLMTRLFPRGA